MGVLEPLYQDPTDLPTPSWEVGTGEEGILPGGRGANGERQGEEEQSLLVALLVSAPLGASCPP